METQKINDGINETKEVTSEEFCHLLMKRWNGDLYFLHFPYN